MSGAGSHLNRKVPAPHAMVAWRQFHGTVLIEFEDGYRVVTTRMGLQRAQRKVTSHPALDQDDSRVVEYADILAFNPCSYCGCLGGGAVDHIMPMRPAFTRELGQVEWLAHRRRRQQWDNLTATCESCNSRKARRSLLQFLAVR